MNADAKRAHPKPPAGGGAVVRTPRYVIGMNGEWRRRAHR
jgi:hypothetical protein